MKTVRLQTLRLQSVRMQTVTLLYTYTVWRIYNAVTSGLAIFFIIIARGQSFFYKDTINMSKDTTRANTIKSCIIYSSQCIQVRKWPLDNKTSQKKGGWFFLFTFFLRFYFFWKFRFSNLYSHVGKGEITSADSRNNTDIKIFLWFKKFKHFDSWITWNPGQEQFWKYYLWRSLS